MVELATPSFRPDAGAARFWTGRIPAAGDRSARRYVGLGFDLGSILAVHAGEFYPPAA